MKRKFILFLFSLFLTFAVGNLERVSACSCGRPDICAAYNFADFVFVGKVIEFKKSVYTFEVEESFIGAEKGDNLKTLLGSGGSCGITFKKNHTYLIFGHRVSEKMRENEFWKHGFWTTVCDRNSEIDGELEDLTMLRNMSSKTVGGKVFGKVYSRERNENVDLPEKSFANISIRIQEMKNNLLDRILKTNTDGKFELEVPVGAYRVTATDLPKGFRLSEEPYKQFEVRNSGCANRSFEIEKISIK